MKLSTTEAEAILKTLAEAMATLNKHLGTDVDIKIPNETPDHEDDCWVANTKMTPGHPDSLNPDTKIEVIHANGSACRGVANDWVYAWDREHQNQKRIVKYRVVG